MDRQLKDTKPDNLTQKIGVLTRRAVEARIVSPIIEALGKSFGKEKVVKVIGDTVVEIARGQGAELAHAMGGDTLEHFMQSLQFWSQDGALELDVLKLDQQNLHFNVTRCRYAEMYKDLCLEELGCVLSCNRDHALIEGFNPDIELVRTQTIMEGATHCDFRYTFRT